MLALTASTISPDAALSAAIVIVLAVLGALWKLATMLGEIRNEVRPNGGGSLKDHVHRTSGIVDEIHTAVADIKASQARIDMRVTEHRRRNDEAIGALRDHLDRKLAGLSEGQARSDALHRTHESDE